MQRWCRACTHANWCVVATLLHLAARISNQVTESQKTRKTANRSSMLSSYQPQVATQMLEVTVQNSIVVALEELQSMVVWCRSVIAFLQPPLPSPWKYFCRKNISFAIISMSLTLSSFIRLKAIAVAWIPNEHILTSGALHLYVLLKMWTCTSVVYTEWK